MRRAPVVIGATVAGLIGVLAFHTSPAPVSLPAVPAAGATRGPASPASPRSTSPGPHSTPPRPGHARPGHAASQAGRAARTAAGPRVNYSYGILSVKVTVSRRKILHVGIASLDDGGNPRSVGIDQQAIPILEQEVMQAQSAGIQGVSGASYTSAGFRQSLQAALHALDFR